MHLVLALLLILILSPVGIFLLHITVHRLSLALKYKVSGHASALITIFIGNFPVLYLAWYFVLNYWTDTPLSVISGLLYTLIVYNVLGILYLDVLNVSETSLHMHILLEIVWNGKLSKVALKELYSPENMIEARIERLTSLGQIQFRDGRYYLGNRSILYLAKALHLWRAILGLPLKPNLGGNSKQLLYIEGKTSDV